LHGHVHGAEMPAAAAPLAYGLGFTLTTLGLQAAGIVFGLTISGIMKENVVRDIPESR
jgi:urease accessory protein